jgi:glycosyltransferase involved in cell wall biosynthesis
MTMPDSIDRASSSSGPHLVSVIIPAYNHAEFVKASLDSVRAQDYRPLELVVVDDASSDETAAQVVRWQTENPEFPVTTLFRKRNGGLCSALNLALSRVSGEIVMVLASDDWLRSDHVSRCVRIFDLNEDAVAVYSDLMMVAEDGAIEHESYFAQLGVWPPEEGSIYRSLVFRNVVPAPGTAIRKRYLTDLGGYDERFSIEDYPMWLRLAHCGFFYWTGHATVYYRGTLGGLSRRDFFSRTLQTIRILDRELAEVSSVWHGDIRRSQASQAKALYAYSRYRWEKRMARQYLREAVRVYPSLSIVAYLVTSHMRIPYSWIIAIRHWVRLPYISPLVKE